MPTRDDLQRGIVYGAEIEQRRATDPLFTWQPTAKQKPFIDCVLSGQVPEAWMVAANRCIVGSQRVLMADLSWRAIKDVRVGDRVLSVDLTPAPWAGVPGGGYRGVSSSRVVVGSTRPSTVMWHGPTGLKPCVRLRISSGKTLECSSDHRILSTSFSLRSAEWRRADSLHVSVGPRGGTSPSILRRYVALPRLISPEVESNCPDWLGRFVGYLLGDGSLIGDCIRFTNTNSEIVRDFLACIPPGYRARNYGGDYFVSVPSGHKGSNGLIRQLREWNLWGKCSHEKFIPTELLAANEKTVRGLVASLFATGGWVSPGGAYFRSTSRLLIDGLGLALLRLGIHSNVTFDGEDGNPRHHSSWTLGVTYREGYGRLPDVPGKPKCFTAISKTLIGHYGGSRHETVKEIEEIGSQNTYDLEIDATSQAFIAEGFIVHNSGKSDSGAYVGAMLARFGSDAKGAYGEDVTVFDRATAGWVVSLDFASSRDTVQPKYFDNGFGAGETHLPFIPQREIKEWRQSDQILLLKGPGSGSIIGFKSSDSTRIKFQGAAKDWIHFDEEPPQDIYEESVIRVAAGRQLRVFGTCTLLPPEGNAGGVSWIYPEIIQPFERGEHLQLRKVFGASIYDNPYVDQATLARLEAIYPEGSVQRRIRLGGEWLPGLAGARAYGSFNRHLHVAAQPPLAPRRPLCWMWDFNVEPLITLVGQRDGKLFRYLREFVLDEGNILEMVDWFREVYPTHTAEIWVYGDATGKGRTGQTGQSDYHMILNAMRSYGPPVRLKVPEVNPLVKDRVNAMNRALKNEQGEICVAIDPQCKELIADLEQVLSDPRGGVKKTSNRGDSYFKRTHSSDAASYWVVAEEPVRAFTTGQQFPRTPVRIQAPGYGFSREESRERGLVIGGPGQGGLP